MQSKLILKIDSNVVKKTKKYAKKKNTTINKIIKEYLKSLSSSSSSSSEITSLVRSISGIISLPKNFNLKKQYRNYILNKY